jgi:hypothetical protein
MWTRGSHSSPKKLKNKKQNKTKQKNKKQKKKIMRPLEILYGKEEPRIPQEIYMDQGDLDTSFT